METMGGVGRDSAVVIASSRPIAWWYAAEATAFGLREALWNLDVIGQWTESADAVQHIPWVRECWQALDAHAMGGVYVNHLGADEPERVRDAYGQNYARLDQVKAGDALLDELAAL